MSLLQPELSTSWGTPSQLAHKAPLTPKITCFGDHLVLHTSKIIGGHVRCWVLLIIYFYSPILDKCHMYNSGHSKNVIKNNYLLP